MSERLYRYFADLRHGSFIFVTNSDNWPPEGYPLIELSEEEVKTFIDPEEKSEKE